VGVIGRAAELERLNTWLHTGILSAAPDAAKTALVIEGEPGIGKTTVWAEGVRQARLDGRTVLLCRPRPSDAGLSNVGLTDLLRTVSDEAFENLPTPQRMPLEVATLRRDVGEGDIEPRAVGTALTALLARLGSHGPLLLAIDDAQWLDPASARALAFALHRQDESDVRLLAAIRIVSGVPKQSTAFTSIESTLGRKRVERLHLGPLSVAAIHALILEALGKSFTRPVLMRVHKASSGNPFYALEIAREVQRLGPLQPGRPLPIPDDHRDLALLRLGRLPRATRDVLAQIAAMSRPSTEDLDLDALAPAERAGIVRVLPGGEVDFTHPLFGSALYSSLPEATRRKLHRGLAAREVRLEERARHLALAASGPDAASADVLDRATESAGARGAAEMAVELKELALRLTPPADAKAVVRRGIELASRRYFAGDAPGARQELERSRRSLPAGEDRAQVLLELASVTWNEQGGDEALAMISQALDEAVTPSLRAQIHSRVSWITEDVDQGLEHAESALVLTEEQKDPVLYSFILHNVARLRYYSGRGADHEAIERGMRLQREAAAWELSVVPAFWARDFDDFDTAIRRFEEIVRIGRERGDEASSCGILAHLALIHSMTGHLSRAQELADEALDLAHQTEQETWIGVSLCAKGQVLARAGKLDEAKAAGDEVSRRLEVHPDKTIEALASMVLGSVAFSQGDYAEADRQFSRTDATDLSHHVRESPNRFHADHAEAVMSLGDLDRAAAMVSRMETRAEALPRPWILAASARCRGLLQSAQGDQDGALASMQEAMKHHEHLDMPLERARTLLALGQVHRRRNERRAARSAFEESLATFERLGVAPWVVRAQAEIARVPVRRASADLTPTEEKIARLAAAGLTNREVADRSFVSAKTVEANLSRVYDKLGVHSRAELGRVMNERERAAKT
jgi:DNA-binding CsgD family transcriptional regulator/predicted negative regulator of RcsB-dependent stress response